MVYSITFCDVEDLESITGLTHDELWENDFNLDDCDGVMILDEDQLPLVRIKTFGDYEKWVPGTEEIKEERGLSNWVDNEELIYSMYHNDIIPKHLYTILNDWGNYCVGAHYTKYNGKVYVSKHHA